MKTLPLLIVAGSLFCAAPMALACPLGQCGGMAMNGLDKNGDGAIDKQEFTAFHEQRFRELDVDHDGKLGTGEMMPGGQCRTKGGQMRFDSRFNEVDINGDGALSKDEAEIGMPMLYGWFDEIDANKDQKISKEEVVSHMQKWHPHPRKGMPGKP